MKRRNTPPNARVQARIILAEATHSEPGEVPEEASIDTWGAWDSLSHVRLIMAIESYLGNEMPPEAVVEITDIGKITEYISKAGA